MYVTRDRTVLAVSEDAAYLSTLKLCMRTCGFSRVQAVTSAVAAVKQIANCKFDLIVSDWDMEPLDGVELLSIVRGMPRSAATPFVLMASDLDEIGWREAVDLGATDFLLKPLTIPALRTVCFHACRPLEFEGANVVPLRGRASRERLQQQIAASLAQESRPPAASVPEVGRGRLRNCYDQILRLLVPASG